MSDIFVSKLENFVRECSDMAATLFEPDGEMRLAHICAMGRDGNITMYAHLMEPDTEAMFRVGIPMELRAKHARRWCFFAEAWQAEQKIGPLAVAPIQHPERIEIIAFEAEDLRGNKVHASRQIYREAGKPARLLPLAFKSGKNVRNFPMDKTPER